MSVLHVGCGTGSITAGVAKVVGSGSKVVGIDRDAELLALAIEEFREHANLTFVEGDVSNVYFGEIFDLVVSARTIQWIVNPEEVIGRLSKMVKPGGQIALLDYDHCALTHGYRRLPRVFNIFFRVLGVATVTESYE
jgi:ubiquinone/menaquinone biosynthesis C-methylase UbiE